MLPCDRNPRDTLPVALRDIEVPERLGRQLQQFGEIQGRGGGFEQARASYLKLREIQEALVRKSASVAEYVLELAVRQQSGPALPQPSRLAERLEIVSGREDAFGRAGGELSEGDQLPEHSRWDAQQLGYQPSKKSGRLDEALPAYREAIKQQRAVMEIAPSVARFREFLGVQYGNFGPALQAAGRFEEALQAALVRKRLRPKDPYRLFEVAADAAAAAQCIDAAGAAIPPDKAKAKEAFSDPAVTGSREAVQTGMDRTQVLRNAADFLAIRGHPGYSAHRQTDRFGGTVTLSGQSGQGGKSKTMTNARYPRHDRSPRRSATARDRGRRASHLSPLNIERLEIRDLLAIMAGLRSPQPIAASHRA